MQPQSSKDLNAKQTNSRLLRESHTIPTMLSPKEDLSLLNPNPTPPPQQQHQTSRPNKPISPLTTVFPTTGANIVAALASHVLRQQVPRAKTNTNWPSQADLYPTEALSAIDLPLPQRTWGWKYSQRWMCVGCGVVVVR